MTTTTTWLAGHSRANAYITSGPHSKPETLQSVGCGDQSTCRLLSFSESRLLSYSTKACMEALSWKKLTSCLTKKPGSDSAAVTAATGMPYLQSGTMKRIAKRVTTETCLSFLSKHCLSRPRPLPPPHTDANGVARSDEQLPSGPSRLHYPPT